MPSAASPAMACDQFAALLPVRERALRAEHPDALAARGNLASWTGKAGGRSGARDQYAELPPVIERALGPEDPATVTTRDNLAYWTGQAGNGAEPGVK